eukprot:CAMPEP_0197038048 /NCGR_PEP_ID=MMETSP1384-20130603/15093_1 /TAXON_ID=29189 /ORGANISM="Ammonia sp." /LENGTH=635 /DNA_ID=CAMNT_0042468441 /DNA_START=30 /DNA_END=1937 /DNA_ORIENTATION=-
MAEQGAAQANAAAGGDGEQQQQGWGSTMLRWFIMYYAINFFMNKWRGNNTETTTPPVDVEGNPIQIPTSQLPHSALWKPDSLYNLRVYLSEQEDLFSVIYAENANDYLIYAKSSVEYSCNDASYHETELNYSLTQAPSLKNNGSLYAHIVMAQFGYPFDENDDDFDPAKVLYRTHPLVAYKRKPKKKKENLLFKQQQDDDDAKPPTEEAQGGDDDDDDAIIGYWKPELTIRPLCDWTTFKANTIPAQIVNHYKIDIESNRYWPVLYMDDFWLLGDKLIALNNASLQEVPLKIYLSPIAQWKFMLQVQMEAQYEQQTKWGMSSSEDNDEVRRLLMESNPILLGVTMVVTLLHTLFDFLAFKNDIQFWHKTESVKGISVRTIFVNAVCQLIIFLYLMDQDTTWMILISSGIGFVIECWKITQAAKVRYGFDLGFPYISIEDKVSYNEGDTKKYDKEAYKYLSWVFYPSLFGYTIYSLIYNEHKGWYSFVIGTCVSFIYMFGFIMMCPQLYLNYKLKSTAFMPWRMMTYKFLNTIIDDLFAFLIKMPTMHRLSCFRDDVIFLIFLYQKWIYRTDYSRVNEYGFKPKEPVDGDADKQEEEKEKKKKITAADTETDRNAADAEIDELDGNVVDASTKKNQ